ncbi:dynamin family protein [Halobacillus litoralis]|uniref:dynamin family protein n=1 Tax=Halobacillus litoralis TaxID=45668 RepID=UPI001CFCD5D1|nr:dynamin family protein [Halobacillus litoralis]
MTFGTKTSLTNFQNLYYFLKEENLEKPSEKVLDLIGKLANEEMVIGVAGHFSAGKSTLINTLLGSDLLPSSPIPTSANIVRIKSGDSYTKAWFKNGPPVQYEEEVNIDTIQSLCTDGEKITGLEISRPEGALPPNVSVVDTPGVDSTNDADRLITESSLHMMDYIFYVMDYNHVQSEVNLLFLLEMQRRQTPFSVVVNQVDKHVSQELTFEQYHTSVKAAFQQWGINPDHIYYTSMRDFSIEYNEFSQLKQDFQSLFTRSQEEMNKQAEKEALTIINETAGDYSDSQEEELEPLRERKEELKQKINSSAVEIEWLENKKNLDQEAKEDFKERIESFVSNAYLMPSSLREYAEAYLHSLQPDFKVGIIFTAKKTEEERRVRKQAFYNQLNESMKENLKWPLRDRMVKLIEKYGITDESFLQEVHQMKFTYPDERLHSLVESGASVTGAYVLRYTNEVAKDIQKEVRSFLADWRKKFLEMVQQKQVNLEKEHQPSFQAIREIESINERISEMNEAINQYRKRLFQSFHDTFSVESERLSINELDERENAVIHKDIGDELLREESRQVESGVPDNEQLVPSKATSFSSIGQTLTRADETLDAIKSVEGLEHLYEQLHKKRNRLDNREYTIALFGAFSAGKSSFANALLGDRVLPVSPNPTTASINKISRPSSGKKNQTVEAKVKTEKQMLEDLMPILSKVDITAHSVQEAIDGIEKLDKEQWTELNQKNYAFLKAFQEGWDFMKEQLGTTITISWDEFSLYVSEEKKSCFIESMELFYDCPWTQAGITLVDTPGADSVNARHTDVSFEYIKDADAILFVTYYNHPFSRADQTFLTQLGRVKDSFAMDKMFFLINAKDLAASEEELIQVESYIENQLHAFQIRNPRLFPVSSLQALEEKQSGNDLESGIHAFEDSFETFLNEELAQMLVRSVESDIQQIKDSLKHFIESSRLSEDDRVKKKLETEKDKERALQVFNVPHDTGIESTLQGKVEKQIHYVHERMMLNFNDLFKRHFNPAVINGRSNDVKEQLKSAQEQLNDEVCYEMLQEVKAVCVRLERFIGDLTQQTHQRIEDELAGIRSSIRLDYYDVKHLPLPDLSGEIRLSDREKSQHRKYFRNTKAFFEKNEKEEMKKAISSSISVVLNHELDDLSQTVVNHYQKQWGSVYKEAVNEWEIQVEHQLDRIIYQLNHPIDPTELEQVLFRIS